MPNHNHEIISKFRRRIFLTLWLKQTVTFCAVFLLLWGVAILAFRVGGVYEPKVFALSLLALAAMPGFAWIVAERRIPSDRKLGAILDRENAAGGLLISSFDVELGRWADSMKTITAPKVRWESRRTVGLVLLAACFAAISLLLPMSAVSGPTRHRLNVDDQVRKLTTQLDVLEEENLLTVEEVEARKLDLERIQNDADGMGPVKTFDALDHIADRMNQKVAEAVENAQRTTESLAEAEALSQQVKELSSQLDETTAKSLMDGLAESIEEMLAQNEQLAEDLKEALAEQAKEQKKQSKGGQDGQNSEQKQKEAAMNQALQKMLESNNMQNMTPEMMQQLCDAMKMCQGNCERMCESLQNAGFPVDQDLLKKLSESRNVDRQQAERLLSDLWANCDGCKGKGNGRCKAKCSPRYTEKQDWTTDPDEEPGDLMFEKEPDEEGVEFKAQFLPLSDLEAFRNSQKIGASISAPDFKPDGTPGDHGGAMGSTGGGTGTAHGQTIYPQHRGPVGRYFGR